MAINFLPTQLIKPQTGDVTTPAIFAVQQRFLTASIFAIRLTGSEEIPIFFTVDNGETFFEAEEDGEPVILTATNNERAIFAPVFLGVTKPVTTLDVGVYILSNATAT